MKIGELARETGVSVRTLHHYDEMKLLTPSKRGGSGHRIYDKNDVVRLHHILSLKRLNLTLQEIRDIIGKENTDIAILLDRNIEALEEEIAEKRTTLDTLRGTRQFLLYKAEVDLRELTNLIKDISLAQKYFNEDQLSLMEDRETHIGAREMSNILDELPQIAADIREAVAQKLPPSDSKVLTVVKRWSEITEALVGDNEEIEAAAQKMLGDHPELLERHDWTEEMLEYMRKARGHLPNVS